MKVLHVITGLAPGGAEQQLRLQLRHTRHDAEVLVLCKSGEVGEAIRRDGTRVIALDMAGNRDMQVLPRLVRVMRAGRYDLVHVHLYRALLYGRIAARMARVPRVVTTEHTVADGPLLEGQPITWWVRALYLATDRLSDATIAVSELTRRALIAWGVPPAKITVIPNGLDADAFTFDAAARRQARRGLGIPDDAEVIGAVGRLEDGKGLDLLITALAPLLDPESGRVLLLVGDGRQRTRLESLAREAGVMGQVRFTGTRLDVPALLSAMDLYVLPSVAETFGLAILEAVACGLPVIYSRCPALEELDVQISCARQVKGDVTAIRMAVLKELSVPRQERNRPEAIDRYAIGLVTKRIDDLYGQVKSGRGSGPVGEV